MNDTFTSETFERYSKWAEDKRRVVVIAKQDKEMVEFDGELRAVHVRGIMIRPRGRVSPVMIPPSDLESLVLYESVPKPIDPKAVSPILFGQFRQHLADRHGFALEDLNAKGYTENQAYDDHQKEHAPDAPKMSHFHREG